MASHIRGLLANGVNVSVLALNTAKHRVDSLPANTPNEIDWHLITCDTTPTVFGLLVNTLFSSESYMVSRFNRSDLRSELLKLLNSKSFDAVILEGLFMAPYLKDIRPFNIPVYLRAHNVEHHIWNRQIEQERSIFRKWILKLQNRRLASYEKRMAAEVDGVIAITSLDQNWYTSFLSAKKVHCMPTGISPSLYPHLGSKTPDVFHLGAMDWIPNVDGIKWFAEKVWPEVLKRNLQTTFHLGGRDSEKLNLHNPSSGFFVEGTVDNAAEFYDKHGIFVVPLLAGSGMRIKVLEAMAYGKAIVGTSIGVEGIPFKHGVHGFIADDAVGFAQAIAELIKDAELRKTLGLQARDLIHSNFDETLLVKDLLTFLKL